MSIVPEASLAEENPIRRLLLDHNGHITTENIEPRSLDAAQVLKANSIGAAQLGTDSVGSDEIAADSVGSDELTTLVDLTKPVVSSLPGSPTDGEVVFFQDSNMASVGVVWEFKYRAAGGTDKWEFVGGPPLVARIATSETRANVAYGDLATVGPDITVPLSGEYDVILGGRIANNTGAGDSSVMSYANGATAASDADAAVSTVVGAISVMARSRTTCSATTTIRAKYRTTAGTGTFIERWIELHPVRV